MNTNNEYFFKNIDNFEWTEIFKNTTKPWEILIRAKEFLKNKEFFAHKCGSGMINVFIGEGTIVHSSAIVQGPVVIGKNCEIGPNAYIRPNTILGDNVVVGHCAQIKASVVLNYAKIQSHTFVGDSVIGESARVGSGAIVSNRKFNQSNVVLKIDNCEKQDLGTSFFGCVLGDNTRIGANATIQPGTLIGPYCWIFPMTCVRGYIQEAKQVFHELPIKMKDNEKVNLSPRKGF